MMMDFVQVMAHYASRDDVVLMALIGLEGEGCFEHKNHVLKALANDIRPKRHRRKLLAGVLHRDPESIEALLSSAERIDRRFTKLTHRSLLAAINDPVLRTQYAISRMFFRIGWRLRLDTLKQYLALRARQPRSRHTFVSFNYDLVLEHALEAAGASWSAKAGYGVRFAWAILEDPSEGAGAPVVPLAGTAASNIRVLKPHGSLNWLLPSDGRTRLPVVATTVEGHVRYIGSTETHAGIRFLDELPVRVAPFILPPTSSKNTDLAILRNLRKKEAAALQSADELYVIGWSIPRTDVDQVKLIQQAVARRQKPFSRVVVVNYRQPERYYHRVARLFGFPLRRVERFDDGVLDFIASQLAIAG